MKTKSMKVEQNISIHNRFDIEVRDAVTGELKQRLYAKNIVLDTMWTRLVNLYDYFVNINYGTGTGTLAANRTSLFTHLDSKAAIDDLLTKALPTSSWRRKIILNPEDNVGAILTEVGIAYGTGSDYLVTHAMLRDMNGNVVSLTKTAFDVITIYGTVYVTFSTSNANLAIIGMPNSNPLVNYLIGGTAIQALYFQTGQATVPNAANYLTPVIDTTMFTSAQLTLSADVANKKFSTNVLRLAIGDSNGHIAEFGFGQWATTGPISRLVLPATGIYSGLELAGVSIGTGNGSTVDFLLPSKNIDSASVVTKMNGTETAVTKTAINKAINFKQESRIVAPMKHDVSGDGSIIAVIPLGYNLNVRVYIYGVADDVITLLQDIPSPAGNMTECALSDDGTILVVGLDTTPYVATYERISGVWTIRATPGTILNRACSGIAISVDGLVMACGGMDQYGDTDIKSYDWVGSAWVVRATPPSFVRGVNRLALDLDGNVLAASFAYSTETAVIVWDWSGSEWVKRANPPSLPNGQGYSACLSNNGLVLGITYDGAAIVWVWGGSSWTKRATAPSLPSTSYHNMHLSSDGNVMICGTKIYDWVSTAWVLRTGGKTYTANDPRIARSSLNLFVSDNGVYDIANRSLKVTFATAPANGAVITADYTVNGIHKTAQRVVDLQAIITFGEPV